MTNHTTTVETLTAGVRVLMLGSRQVTMSVYGQLDDVEYDQIEPFGRVMPKDARPGYVYVIGKRTESGELVRSWLPCTEKNIECWVDRGSLAASCERSAQNAEDLADQHEREATRYEEQASALLSDGYVSGRRGAEYHDEVAADYGQAAEAAERAAQSETDEISRLDWLANAARARHAAATSRRAAEESRTTATALFQKAQDHRNRAEASKVSAKELWETLNERLRRDERETRDITQTSWEWSRLPLIVLAGLR